MSTHGGEEHSSVVEVEGRRRGRGEVETRCAGSEAIIRSASMPDGKVQHQPTGHSVCGRCHAHNDMQSTISAGALAQYDQVLVVERRHGLVRQRR